MSRAPPARAGQSPATRRTAAAVPEQNLALLHDRALFLIAALLGFRVRVATKEGACFEGILSSSTSEGEISIALKHARRVDQNDAPSKRLLLLQAKDIADIHVADVDLEKRVASISQAGPSGTPAQNGADTFRTDTDISGAPGVGSGRLLQRWDASAVDESLELNGQRGGESRGGAWDQFATNERMFGTKTDYNEELYTTKLDRTSAGYREQERRADRLAAEILAGSSSNAHVLEERNAAASAGQQGGDEEDRYGAVIRGPNAYVPPGARPAATGAGADNAGPASAVNGAGRPAPVAPTSVRQPSQILNSTSSAPHIDGGASTQTEGSSSLNQLVPDLKQFVASEKEKLIAKRQAQAKKEKDNKLADLLKFSQTFKLNAPIPQDLMPILAKQPEKQKEITEKASRPANVPEVYSKPAATALASNMAIEPEAAKTSAAFISAKPAGASRTPDPPTSQQVVASASSSGRPTAVTRASIAPIPPFNARNKTQVASTNAAPVASTSGAPALPGAQSTASTSSAAAKLNPNVVAFVPNFGGSSATATPAPETKPAVESSIAAAPTTAASARAEVPLAPPQALNPFFGSKAIKRGSSSMHVKEDFTPFKLNASIPQPASVPDTWGFQGRSTRDLLLAPASRDEDASVSQSPGSAVAASLPSPHSSQGPPYPVYRGYGPAQIVMPNGQAYAMPSGGPPTGAFPTQFVGHGGFPQNAVPHQGYPPNSSQNFVPVYRGPQMYQSPPVYFTTAMPGTPPMQANSPGVNYRRLSGAGPSPAPYAVQMTQQQQQ